MKFKENSRLRRGLEQLVPRQLDDFCEASSRGKNLHVVVEALQGALLVQERCGSGLWI